VVLGSPGKQLLHLPHTSYATVLRCIFPLCKDIIILPLPLSYDSHSSFNSPVRHATEQIQLYTMWTCVWAVLSTAHCSLVSRWVVHKYERKVIVWYVMLQIISIRRMSEGRLATEDNLYESLDRCHRAYSDAGERTRAARLSVIGIWPRKKHHLMNFVVVFFIQ